MTEPKIDIMQKRIEDECSIVHNKIVKGVKILRVDLEEWAHLHETKPDADPIIWNVVTKTLLEMAIEREIQVVGEEYARCFIWLTVDRIAREMQFKALRQQSN